MAGVHERFVVVHNWRVGRGRQQSHIAHFVDRQTYRQRSMHFHVLDLCDLAVFFEDPQFLQHLFELFFVRHCKSFLRRDLAMVQLNSPVA